MKLLMYNQNDLIDCVRIDPDKIVYPGYLSSFIRQLREKHRSLFLHPLHEPEFLLGGNFLTHRPEPQLKLYEVLHSDDAVPAKSVPLNSVSGTQQQLPVYPFH